MRGESTTTKSYVRVEGQLQAELGTGALNARVNLPLSRAPLLNQLLPLPDTFLVPLVLLPQPPLQQTWSSATPLTEPEAKTPRPMWPGTASEEGWWWWRGVWRGEIDESGKADARDDSERRARIFARHCLTRSP